MPFASLDDIRAFCRDLPGGDRRFADMAAQRQQNLTKPPGSLGRLEELAIWLAQWQGREKPLLERVTIAVFAGNHGVAARGVSAYPQAVTAQMVANFAAGGAAINQIARATSANLCVVPIELERPTRDFTEAAAMSPEEFLEAVDAGYRTVPDDCDGALGRPRHRRRRRRAGAQARGDRNRTEFPSQHSRRSAGCGDGTGWPRTCGDRRRGTRRKAT